MEDNITCVHCSTTSFVFIDFWTFKRLKGVFIPENQEGIEESVETGESSLVF